jgi:hypothetical protein
MKTTRLKKKAGGIHIYNIYFEHQILSSITATNVYKQCHKPDTYRKKSLREVRLIKFNETGFLCTAGARKRLATDEI